MTRIFVTLSAVGTLFVLLAFFMGLNIEDASKVANQASVSRHMLMALGGLCFASLVHAIVFTYFMGTGRWIEETSRAYSLPTGFHEESQKIKYRLLPLISLAIVALVVTGAFGGAADPASVVGFKGWFGLNAGQVHMAIAICSVVLNFFLNVHEFRAIERNGEIIETVLGEVRKIRLERGLPV